MTRAFLFRGVWGSRGWVEPALVTVDDGGTIQSIAQGGGDAKTERVEGWALPGVPNAHSHAFQYAMAGLAENLPFGRADDDFWSWRETMYSLALTITPEKVRAIAAHLYAEMLRRGFTSVAEFHYLHRAPDGKPYPNATAVAEALCEAATQAGIRLTLVPVHYRTQDFGAKDASPRQRRFLFDSADAYLRFAEACEKVAKLAGHRIAGGVHSLRASPPEDTVQILTSLPKEWPRHLHVAEQRKEVESCLAILGCRPVEWLLKNVSLDERYHLVHATHVTPEERHGIARAGANVVLCPTTEANLGDGIFPLAELRAEKGRFSIGTDSHVGIDPWEELRWADYTERLRLQRRNPLLSGGEESGEVLLRAAVQSGGRAMGRGTDSFLDVGDPLDAAVVDASDPLWEELPAAHRVSTQIFATPSRPLLGVLVGGRWVARQGKHLNGEPIAENARAALKGRH